MPGAFHSEGVHPGLIRPPESPAVTPGSAIFSSTILNPESPSTPSALPRPTYKRRRPGLDSSTTTTTGSGAPGAAQARGRHAQSITSDKHGFATGRSYVLAGNLDTPGAVSGPGGVVVTDALADPGVLGESMFSDSDYRTVLGSKRRREDTEPDHIVPPTLYKLPTQPSQKAAGWGAFTFTTLGGVVSKVWDFCWGSTFRGFHAGDGRGYDLQPGGPDEDTDSAFRGLPGAWDSHDHGQSDSHAEKDFESRESTTTDHDTYDPVASTSRASTPTRQPAKRRHMDKSDELGRNWVVINQHDAQRGSTPASRPRISSSTASSRNRNSMATPTKGRRVTSGAGSRLTAESGRQTPLKGTPGRRPSSRTSSHFGGRANTLEKPLAASTASYASPRSSPNESQREFTPRYSRTTTSTSRRSSVVAPIDTTAAGADARCLRNTPSRPGHRRTHSNASAASPRSPQGEPATILHRRQTSAREMSRGAGVEGDDNIRNQSPRLTDEARRLAAKRKMEERDADVRIAAFNRRLQDMIRQGKEALGTTVDVEMEGPGEGGWEDDE